MSKFMGKAPQKLYIKSMGTVVLIISACSLLSLFYVGEVVNSFKGGGVIGMFVSGYLLRYFGYPGTYIILIALVLLSILIATEFFVLPFLTSLTGLAARFFMFLWKVSVVRIRSRRRPKPIITADSYVPKTQPAKFPLPSTTSQPKPKVKSEAAVKPKLIQIKQEQPAPKPVMTKVTHRQPSADGYKLPPLDLLNSPPPLEERRIKDDLAKSSLILEETLRDFNIEVRVAEVERGPVITRYELEPAPGVKVNRIVSLSDDIALAMKAQSVRIVAPIPGKARVGVEVPNSSAALVYLQEVIGTGQFQSQSKECKLTMALGKDVSGAPIITDLGDMPHFLIAGTTGSGKTVCVNTIITSMLYSNTPDELRFVMIDPKMVELAIFNDLPHLLCPVVTDPKKVAATLNWVVEEMDARYRLLAKAGTRNIELYNEKMAKQQTEELPARLPYLVVIIDELADLMMVVASEVENTITRLAQLSRAVGIHIILATQRPSVDVVTGVIKANFPARISFKVASKVDSRTVLDANGADKLLGKGDMLFLKPGASKPIRGQCSLVSDQEIERIVSFIKSQRKPEYEETIIQAQEKISSWGASGRGKLQKDPFYEEAVSMVLETGQASVSMLQRRLRLSHIRAARIIDYMEQEGLVGPYQGSKAREILVPHKQAKPDEVADNR
jgi:S-DNA-T family DNA segregation ATPase FtsK/SpoIIIE